MTRIFFASDMHGSDLCFRKFVNAVKFYDIDILILGGDLTAKSIIPIVNRNGVHQASIFGKLQTASTEDELSELAKRIVMNGFYAYQCEPEEYEEILGSREKQNALFRQLILKSLERWLDLATERLSNTRTRCYIMPGNDDDPEVSDILNHSGFVINPESVKVELPGGYEMISVGYSNRTPFDSPRELDEDALYRRILEQARSIQNPEKAIFNLHCPPYDCGLDIAPELTRDLEIVFRGGQPSMIPVGSTAVRRAIEEVQPLLGLHGHIHESRGAAKIGRTLCVNPGSEYPAGILQGIIIILDKEKIKRYQFVSG